MMLFFLTTLCLFGMEETTRPVHTYSIVAYDPATGEVGAAVQSHWFSVGSVVIWAEPGVGAVATQSFVRRDYGPLGLAAMAAGTPPAKVLANLRKADEGRAVRQVAMVDAQGRVSAFTGENCIDFACDLQGKNFSVQANLMLKDTVCRAMVMTFERTKGPLAERMLAAMKAAQDEGGDLRGQQSAAIKVVRAAKPKGPGEGVLMELRVEDHPKPIEELTRLIRIHRAYDSMNQGDLALEHGDVTKAMALYESAGKQLPNQVEPQFWQAVNLVAAGKVDESLPLFHKVFSADTNWRVLPERLMKVGLLANDPKLLEKILAK